jgi:tetratricopeptide (TPR) repeat protein
MLVELGDIPAALENFHRAGVEYASLIAADANDANIRRDLAVNYRKTGEAFGKMKDGARALENFGKSLRIFDELAAQDPANAVLKRHQGLTYLMMSVLCSDTGDAQCAINAANRTRAIDEALLATDGTNTAARNNLGSAYFQLGKGHSLLASAGKQRDEWRQARDWYQKSLTTWQELKADGKLAGKDSGKADQVTGEIAKCVAALSSPGTH